MAMKVLTKIQVKCCTLHIQFTVSCNPPPHFDSSDLYTSALKLQWRLCHQKWEVQQNNSCASWLGDLQERCAPKTSHHPDVMICPCFSPPVSFHTYPNSATHTPEDHLPRSFRALKPVCPIFCTWLYWFYKTFLSHRSVSVLSLAPVSNCCLMCWYLINLLGDFTDYSDQERAATPRCKEGVKRAEPGPNLPEVHEKL